MRLLYFSNERIPGSSACSIQQMNMCEAFAKLGLNVILIRPFYFELARYNEEAIRDFYDIEERLPIKTLPTLLSLSKPVKGRGLQRKNLIPFIGGTSMLFATWYYCFWQLLSGQFATRTIIYSRNVNATMVLLYLRRRWFPQKPVNIFFEIHSLDQQRPKKFFRQILKECDGLISITSSLKSAIIDKYGITEDTIFVAPDGVKGKRLTEPSFSQKDARFLLNIPSHYAKIILYTGQILPGKGVEVFIEAASKFDEDVLFLIVGGTEEQIVHLRKTTAADRLRNVQFKGFFPPRSIPMCQAAADILVLPNTSNSMISNFTSPLKLFEYMTTGKPIVSSDLPAIKEILTDGENAVLVKAGNAKALASGIRRLLMDETLAEKISLQAQIDVHQFTWERRAQNILTFLNHRIKTARDQRTFSINE
jgi:glycosyltransferase involved in cell wall biosynthesis